MVSRILYERVSTFLIGICASLANLFRVFFRWPSSSLVYMLLLPVFLSLIFMVLYFIFYKNDINHRYIIVILVFDIMFVIGEFWVLCNI